MSPKVSLSQISCPSCQGPVSPVRVRCEPCDLTIEGQFETSEFASLGAEDLHFLRIFIHTEGSIREMESALGLSYPTIKSRLANLKKRLGDAGVPAAIKPEGATRGHQFKSVDQVLTALESGQIGHAESVLLIKKLK